MEHAQTLPCDEYHHKLSNQQQAIAFLGFFCKLLFYNWLSFVINFTLRCSNQLNLLGNIQMARSLAGTRIRQRRRSLGLTQKALAEKAGISPSYLNLIEHNRRAIAGKVMNALARALDTPARDLSEGPEIAIASTLEEIAAASASELENPEDLLARFPGWSRKLANLHEHSVTQSRMIEALGDRLTHDPYLSESLHLMLSSITAIRATASLMTSVDEGEMDLANSRRFNQNIHSESLRLSDAAQASPPPERARN